MKYVLEVCLVALALTITNAPRVAAQTMQKGVSVQLPVTGNAVPMPDADQPNAPIVSVTADGGVYLGVDQISPTALAEKVKDSLFNQPDKRLYIKADARAPYGDVVKILDAVRTADVGAVTLLTAQRVVASGDASTRNRLASIRGPTAGLRQRQEDSDVVKGGGTLPFATRHFVRHFLLV